MDRRDFLKLAAFSGMSVLTPNLLADQNGGALYTEGLFFINVFAGGGWDVTMFCDPKGHIDGGLSQEYQTGDIQSTGNISYAPPTPNFPANNNQHFFEKYASELLIVNGIDTTTNAHLAGTRYAATGNLQSTSYPSFAALYAATKSDGNSLPLGYLSYGSVYANTANLLPVSRLQDVDSLRRLVDTNVHREGARFRSEFSTQRVAEALKKQNEKQTKAQFHPRTKRNMATLYTAQLSARKLKELSRHLPATLPESPFERQIVLSLAACAAGICISADLELGGFDSHDNNEARQSVLLDEYTKGIELLLERAETLNIRERVLVMMTSEFSRTPVYNTTGDQIGKDHWPVNSAMFIGPGVPGNKVVGQTTEGHFAMGFDPANHVAIPYVEDQTLRITPRHISESLRKFTGISTSENAKKFALKDGDVIDIFQA